MKEFIRLIISKLFRHGVYYVGSSDILPPPLSKEEEDEALELARMGDVIAKNKLIEHNLRLVVFLAKKYENTNVDLEDLVSIGTIGLIKGVDSFKESNGAKLTTYAARCIENEILMHYRSNKKNSKNVSLEESIGYDKEGNEITIADVLKTKEPDFIEDIKTRDDIKKLKKYLSVLSDREKNIIIARYGLDGDAEITQKNIAKKLNISRSYVSRIEKRALTKLLREFLRNNKS